MKDALRNYLDRPKRYDNIDGTGEIFLGLMVLGGALAGCLEANLATNSSRWTHAVTIYAAVIPALGLGYWIRRIVKKRITWPRTGYAAYPRGGKSRWVGMIAAAVIGAVVTLLLGLASRHGAISLRQISMVAICLGTYGLWVWRMGKEQPWKWLALLFMALGFLAIAIIVPGGSSEWSRLVMLVAGLVWLGSGGATLYFYIRHTQPPAPPPK